MQWFDFGIVVFSSAAVFVSLVVANNSQSWHWFSRSGAIFVLGGAILEYRNADFVLDGKRSFRYTTIDGMAAMEVGSRSRIVLKWLAHFMVIGGTLIAGYGDLLG